MLDWIKLRNHTLFTLAFLAMLLTLTMAQVNAAGKFYIIGMGTSPDLVTVRGARILNQADLFVLEGDSDRKAWAEYIGDKETCIAEHGSRVGYGVDPKFIKDPEVKAMIVKNAKSRQQVIDKIREAIDEGKTVVAPCWGDPMVYGTVWYLEMLPKSTPSEIVPGLGAFEAGSAALKKSTTFGYDTNSVVLTMADWPGRIDTNEKIMKLKTSMVFYTMHLNYPKLFAQLKKYYPAATPVAVVSYAGDPDDQKVIYSTVGKFLKEVDYANLPADLHMLYVGKFIVKGQARNDGLVGAAAFEAQWHKGGGAPHNKK